MVYLLFRANEPPKNRIMPKQKVDRKYIIKQALLVFRSKGYNHTSMDQLAKACGLQKGSLYHHFNSKQALMKAVIEHMHAYFSKDAFAQAYEEDKSALDRLRFITDTAEVQYFASESGCLFGNLALETADTSPELSQMVRDFFDEWASALAFIFKGRMSEREALELAKDSLAETEGAVMMMRLYNDQDFLKRAHKRIIARFERALV